MVWDAMHFYFVVIDRIRGALSSMLLNVEVDMQVFFRLGGMRIPSYGLMLVISLAVSNLLAWRVLRRHGLSFFDFLVLEGYALVFGFIGAKIFYIYLIRHLISWKSIVQLSYLNWLMGSGFVFYGVVLAAPVGAILAGKIHRITVKPFLDRVIFLFPLAHGFGRIGCFLAGCCYGIPYSGKWAVVFPASTMGLSGVPLFPVQLVEAMLLFILSLILYVLQEVKKWRYTLSVYLIAYGIIRFVLEYFRFDAVRGSFSVFSTSQWISLFLILAAIMYGGYCHFSRTQDS